MPRPKFIGPQPPCSVEGCLKARQSRTYCSMHYARLRLTGSLELAPKVRYDECIVDGCSSQPRSGLAEYCEVHYYRLRRNGSLETLPIVYVADEIRAAREEAARDRRNKAKRRKRLERNPNLKTRRRLAGPCLADGCEKPMEVGENGLCRMHNIRLKRRGDLNFEYGGENHQGWTGDDATYEAVHDRVRKRRGSARSYCCVGCSNPAAHWSYNRTDPNQKVAPGKGPYSTDVDHYVPRCVSCHKRFDMQYVMAERAS